MWAWITLGGRPPGWESPPPWSWCGQCAENVIKQVKVSSLKTQLFDLNIHTFILDFSNLFWTYLYRYTSLNTLSCFSVSMTIRSYIDMFLWASTFQIHLFTAILKSFWTRWRVLMKPYTCGLLDCRLHSWFYSTNFSCVYWTVGCTHSFIEHEVIFKVILDSR